MILEELDTSKMFCDPKGKNFLKDITDKIPEFAEYKAQKVNREKAFMYLVLMYDMRTPTTFEVLNYFQKKKEVADMVGFAKNEDGYYEKQYEKIITGQDDKFNELCALYISIMGMPVYNQYIAYKVMLASETKNALNFKSTGNEKTIANIKKLTEDLAVLERQIFQSNITDEITNVRKALYAQLERDKAKVRVEHIVKKYIEEDGALPPEFDQYPTDGKKHKVPLGNIEMHYYNETSREREQRKRDEEDAQV